MIMLTFCGLQGGWYLQRDLYLPCINNPCKSQMQIKKAVTLVWTVDFLCQSSTLTYHTCSVFLSTSVISATSSTTLQPDYSMEPFLNYQDRVFSFPSPCNTISDHFSRALQHKSQGVCGCGGSQSTKPLCYWATTSPYSQLPGCLRASRQLRKQDLACCCCLFFIKSPETASSGWSSQRGDVPLAAINAA